MTTFQVRAQFFVKPLDPGPHRGWTLHVLEAVTVVDAETEEEAIRKVASRYEASTPAPLTDPAPFDPMAEPEEPLVP